MNQQLHILYLPGLGDNLDTWRLRALTQWRFRDVSVELVPMKWGTGTFEQKIARIDQAIDRASDKRIVLLGESAGGSMVVHTMARRGDDIHKAMTICGKNTNPQTVGQSYYDKYPTFKASMDVLNESLKKIDARDRQKFISIHPLFDPVVPVKDTKIKGGKDVTLPVYGHFVAIGFGLTVLSPIIVRAARR